MEELINEIQEVLNDTINIDLNINDVVTEINKSRALGSSNQCYKVMYKIVQYFNIEKMLEIGTHQAASTIVYCQGILDNGKYPEIHTIDNWSQANLENQAANNIKKAGFEKYITMHKGDSLIKVPMVFNEIGNVDLAFIDGNHLPEYVIGDFNNCKSYTDLIIFHDTGLGERPYLQTVKNDGWEIYNFPTKYIEGDGHLVGISLAVKIK